MAKQKKGGKNKFAQKAKQAGFIDFHQRLQTKDNIKNSALETGKDLLIGVIGGGVAGAAIGKPSLLVGIGLTGAGHFTDNHLLKLFGIGLMASNGFQRSKSVNGLEGLDKQAILNRIQAYKDNFSEKLFIDKLTGKRSANAESANGIGELQFFNYPNDVNGAYDELAALEDLEQQIAQSGIDQMQVSGMGEFGEFGEFGEIGELASLDASDLNL
ncbi:MAG: hypothetical protein JNM41_11740 [Flavipsychrobacter sp.]|nr:hypothetical protein [Flavipsychrobacter sp.]